MLGKTEGRRKRGRQKIRWLDGITYSNGHEFEQTQGVSEGQGSLVCCSPWCFKESDMTEPLNNTNKTLVMSRFQPDDSNMAWSPAELKAIYLETSFCSITLKADF